MFSIMKSDLESEKRSMVRIWKQRNKEINNFHFFLLAF